MFLLFYVLCMIYCLIQLIRRYRQLQNPSMIRVSFVLDVIMVLMLSPVLTIVDVSLTWIKLYKKAEETKRNRERIF